MAIEFEKLVAYFTGDISQLQSAAAKATSIVDALEARINKFKGEIKLTANSLQATSSVEALDKSFTSTKKAAENLKTTIEAIAPKPTISRYWENEAAEVKKSVAIIEKSVASTNRNNPGADSLKRIGAFKFGNTNEPQATVKAPAVAGVDVEFQRAQAIVKNYQRQIANGEKQLTQLVQQQAEAQYRARTKQIEQSAKEYLKELKKIEAAEKKKANSKNTSGFGSDLSSSLFGAATLGTIAGGAILSGVSLITRATKELASEILNLGVSGVQVAATFGATTKSFELFTGSTRRAKEELALIDEAARNTPGLRLEAAEAGVTSLRSLGFEAETSRKIIVGLAKQKLINPLIDEGAVNRVIVNLTQLSSGSARASQDLKELKQAIPTLGPILEQAFKTADPKKIGAIFKNNPDEALKKFADALEKAKAPAGGLNDSIDKLYDSFIEVGRVFGEPILSPLTESVKNLTSLVYENKDAFRSLGQGVADFINGVNKLKDNKQPLADAPSPFADPYFDAATLAAFIAVPPLGLAFAGGGLLGQSIKRVENTGANARNAQEQQEFQRKLAVTPNLFNSDNTVNLDVVGASNVSPEERAADELAAQTRLNRAKEVARQQDLVSLQLNAKQAEQILKGRYAIEQALLDSSVRYTSDQEKQYIAQSFALKARAIQAEIAQQAGFFNKQIQLNEGNTVEIEKLESEKSLTLGKLDNDLKLNSIARAKEIAAIERKSYEERRQAAIEFQNLRVQEVNFQVDNEISDIQRAIEQRNDASDGGYARLVEITNKGYNLVLQATRESLALQLQDQTLTEEQRDNLIRKGYLEEAKLAEENRRNLLRISDDQYQKQIQNLKSYTDFVKGQFKDFQESFSGVGSFFNPDTFDSSTVGNLQESLLKTSAVEQLQAKAALAKIDEDAAAARLDSFRSRLPPDNSPLTDKQTEALNRLDDAYLAAINKSVEYQQQLQAIADSIPGAYQQFFKLAQSVGAGNFKAFDEASQKLLEIKQRFETEDINADIDLVENLISEAKKRGDSTLELTRQLSRLNTQKGNLGISQQIESAENYKKSLEGLTQTIARLRSGDASAAGGILFANEKANAAQVEATLRNIVALKNQLKGFETSDKTTIQSAAETAQAQLLQQQVGSYQQLIYLKEQLANYDKTEQLQIQIAAEERLLAIRQASTEQAIAANQTIQDRVNLTLAQLPAYQTQIKDFFGQLPESIGNIFNTAAQQFDGTFKSLFKSIGQSFAQLLQQLAADLLRAQVIKLIGSLVGSLFGGLGGSFGGGGSSGFSGAGAFGGSGFGSRATGGLITGAGTATSDSIPVMVSNGEFVQQAKAVDYYGVEFMNMVNQLKFPRQTVQFADGGFIRGAGTATSDSIPIYASNGEFVQQAQAVQYYGVDFMNALNNRQFPKPAERQKFATGGLVTAGPNIFVPTFEGNENANLQNNNTRSSGNRSGTTINNTINIPQTFNAPRGTIAPKSLKQSQEHALAGVSRGLRDK